MRTRQAVASALVSARVAHMGCNSRRQRLPCLRAPQVLDEPLYANYLRLTGLPRPYKEQVCRLGLLSLLRGGGGGGALQRSTAQLPSPCGAPVDSLSPCASPAAWALLVSMTIYGSAGAGLHGERWQQGAAEPDSCATRKEGAMQPEMRRVPGWPLRSASLVPAALQQVLYAKHIAKHKTGLDHSLWSRATHMVGASDWVAMATAAPQHRRCAALCPAPCPPPPAPLRDQAPVAAPHAARACETSGPACG